MGGARAFQVEATAYAEPEEEEWVVEDPKMLERVNHRGCCSPTMDSNARPKKSWTGLAFQRFLWRVASGSSWERTPECRQREEMGGYWDSQGTWLWQLGQGPLRPWWQGLSPFHLCTPSGQPWNWLSLSSLAWNDLQMILRPMRLKHPTSGPCEENWRDHMQKPPPLLPTFLRN